MSAAGPQKHVNSTSPALGCGEEMKIGGVAVRTGSGFSAAGSERQGQISEPVLTEYPRLDESQDHRATDRANAFETSASSTGRVVSCGICSTPLCWMHVAMVVYQDQGPC